MTKEEEIRARVRMFVEQHRLLTTGEKVLAALSGGADSVYLLRWLVGEGYDVVAAHCNFQLRGAESVRDEEFVKGLTSRLGVELRVVKFDTTEYAHTHGISIEMAARDLRYDYFNQLCDELGIGHIAVAHHRDDSIETALLNMVRGTGIQGMTGIRPHNGRVVRPLLCVSHGEIVGALTEMGQDFVVDSTNLAPDYSRNKVRLEVMPLLRSINAGADSNILTTIENLSEANKVYSAAIQQMWDECTETISNTDQEAPDIENHDTLYINHDTLYINIEKLADTPSPISVLHHGLSRLGFNRATMTGMLACRQVGTEFASPTHRAIIDRKHIIVAPWPKSHADEAVLLSEFPSIAVERIPAGALEINRSPRYAYIDAATLHGNLTVRRPKSGDRFKPFGMKGSKLLSDFLTDQKLSVIEKENQLVVCDDRDIVWVVGRRSSDKHKVTAATRDVIVLKI